MSAQEAGREMDARVAEKVMGWQVFPYMMGPGANTITRRYADKIIGTFAYCPPNEALHVSGIRRVPDYSTDIAAAWLVIERLRHRITGRFCIDVFRSGNCEVSAHIDDESHRAIADTAPLAICVAALKAVEP